MNAMPADRVSKGLVERDLATIWHPCTQMRDHAGRDPNLPMIAIARGEGACLIDTDGRRYVDAVSSWWTNIFGHANPRIAAAVKRQLDKLEHVIFAVYGSEAYDAFSSELSSPLPDGS